MHPAANSRGISNHNNNTNNNSKSSDDSAAATALRGASLAWTHEKVERVPPSQSLQPHTHTNKDHDAALTAATASAAAGRARIPKEQHQGFIAARLHQLGAASAHTTTYLAPTQAAGLGRADAKSPSLIAATLAASRSASPNAAARTVRRVGSVGTLSSLSSGGGDAVDLRSLAPTGSLVHRFERKRGDRGPDKGTVSPPEENGSSADERLRVPAKASVRKPKSKSEGQPPTPPPARQSNTELLPSKRPPSPPAITPARVSKPKPKTPVVNKGQTRSMAPTPSPRGSSPPRSQSTPKSSTKSLQKVESRSSTPPKLSPSSRRPMTPTSMPNSNQPTLTTSSTQQRQPSPLAQGIGKTGTVVVTPSRSPSTPQTRQTPSSTESQSPSPPVIQKLMPEVVSPQPRRISKSALSPINSPHLALNPVQSISPPSPDPPKRSPEPKRPPTPPKPRGSTKVEQPTARGRPRGKSDASTRAKSGSIGMSHTGGRSVPPPPVRQANSRHAPPLPSRGQTIISAPSSPTRDAPRRRLTNPSTTSLQLGSLTDAIVAGSLASARITPHNTGTSLPPLNLPKRQKSPKLLQTLRQPVSLSDEESDRHKKAHHPKLRKGKHAHHEGSRKRWREEITQRERKRYEGLWASNRGYLLNGSPSSSVGDVTKDLTQYVANIVVREVWRRSRLPVDELAEIWDLVDRDRGGMLNKQEFVVGTWLVDQRLKGRKVPARVMDSVWGSANGVTIRKPKNR
ncbi:Increased rDNA silencing protein 4 [Cladobotryum mycophilum]|uniref:Increased rDNA silencing protein 4 n=1 Tax=Cladobotryum mycophilum TaxID=491253 RepID=A0ABR0T0X3_9HYPO